MLVQVFLVQRLHRGAQAIETAIVVDHVIRVAQTRRAIGLGLQDLLDLGVVQGIPRGDTPSCNDGDSRVARPSCTM